MAKFLVSELNDRVQELIRHGETVVDIDIEACEPDPDIERFSPYYEMSFVTTDEFGDSVESEPIQSVE